MTTIQPQDEINLKFKGAELGYIYNLLMERPFKEVKLLIDSIENQVNEHNINNTTNNGK